MIVLGIDPGSYLTGYGVIRKHNNRLYYIASGCIRLTDKDMPVKLLKLHQAILQLIDTYDPSDFVIEKVFVKKNVDSALKLGQARGVILAAMATQFQNNINEYSPRLVKKAITGYGAAEKSQVQLMVKSLLSLQDLPQEDAADALALAICHLNNHRILHA